MSQRRESGQAAVESAIVLPLMVFLTLGIIQLTMMQQARIMTEYAAYNAVRAGIVWNGNNERMHDAAIVSLLPTMGKTNNILELGKTWAVHALYDTALSQLGWGMRPAFNGSNLVGFIRIDTINPAEYSPIASLWRVRSGMNWQELDFDGPDTYPEIPGLERLIIRFFNLAAPDSTEEIYRKATILSIRVRYWYEMKIPFANWIIFTAWYAANAGVTLYGAIDRPGVEATGTMLKRTAGVDSLQGQARGIRNQRGLPTTIGLEMRILWELATGDIPLLSGVVGKRYFIPLSATYSMRMQSNFHRKWNMHINPEWGL